ncbi:MAG: SPASM domain-containing protein [Desulfobacterales bacterium]
MATFRLLHNRYTDGFIQRLRIEKMQKACDRLRRRMLVRIGADFHHVRMIALETITACNLRCSYCPNSIYERGLPKNKQYMDKNLFAKIMDELAKLRWCGEIQPHSYGEPLLDERLAELISYARKKISGLRVHLFTKGELLNVAIYLELVRAGVTAFTVTQHLPKQSQGVLDVLEYRRQNGASNVAFSYTKKKHVFNRCGLVKVANEAPCKTCTWPCHNIVIDYEGNVLVCCHDYLEEVIVGNARSQSLIDIWNSTGYQDIRRDIRQGKFNLSICKKCRKGTVLGSKPASEDAPLHT